MLATQVDIFATQIRYKNLLRRTLLLRNKSLTSRTFDIFPVGKFDIFSLCENEKGGIDMVRRGRRTLQG